MSQHYRISEEDWAWLESEGFLGVNVWGGTAFLKPGYKPILFRPDYPRMEVISEDELNIFVEAINGSPGES